MFHPFAHQDDKNCIFFKSILVLSYNGRGVFGFRVPDRRPQLKGSRVLVGSTFCALIKYFIFVGFIIFDQLKLLSDVGDPKHIIWIGTPQCFPKPIVVDRKEQTSVTVYSLTGWNLAVVHTKSDLECFLAPPNLTEQAFLAVRPRVLFGG